jgi:hypothetical protein
LNCHNTITTSTNVVAAASADNTTTTINTTTTTTTTTTNTTTNTSNGENSVPLFIYAIHSTDWLKITKLAVIMIIIAIKIAFINV